MKDHVGWVECAMTAQR